MKSRSIWSFILILLGLLFFGLNWMVGYFELIVLIGAIFICTGALFSFIAILKNEKGSMKYILLVSFFVILFFITWFEPHQVLRIITWLKNIV
ncbi:hypothetical protein SPD48_10290 [Pseudogracilibacillus sp. SE30717A]|uniref:hypothetical protein n=1 Tax=Pseudogracilibacillus sp. SE30717A TaxID=3098293 RepID=UPI00300DE7E7